MLLGRLRSRCAISSDARLLRSVSCSTSATATNPCCFTAHGPDESIGLLPEPDRLHGQRRYDAGVLGRLAFIGVAQSAGFKLAEIMELVVERTRAMKGWLEVAQAAGAPPPRSARSSQRRTTSRSRSIWCASRAGTAGDPRCGASPALGIVPAAVPERTFALGDECAERSELPRRLRVRGGQPRSIRGTSRSGVSTGRVR